MAVDELVDLILTFLSQIAGGPGPVENNLVRFGLPALFWAVLLAVAWSRQRHEDLPRERLLMWGFGLGLARELFMFGHAVLRILNPAAHDVLCVVTGPVEHALALAAVVVVGGSYLRYILDDARLARRYLEIGLGVTVPAFVAAYLWWAKHVTANPGARFHDTWPAALFHLMSSILIAVAIFILARKQGWLRNVVLLALTFFFLGEFIILVNLVTGRVHSQTLCPIGNSFHIWAIPLLGYVYFREQSIEKKRADQALEAYRDHLEELVEARTGELTSANQQLQREIAERIQTQEALEQLSRQHELILNAAGEGIFGVGLDGKHTFVNPAAARMLGYEPEELVGQPSHATWHHSKPDGSPYPEQECPLHTGYKTGVACRGQDQVFWRKDDASFPVRYVSTPIHEQGKLTGAVVVFQDITARKRADEEIARRNAALAAQAAIAATISQSLDLDRILNAALDRALAVLGMDAGCIFLLDPDEATLQLTIYRGGELADGLAEKTGLRCLCETVSQQAVTGLQPVILNIPDVPTDCQTLLMPQEELRVLVSTPLISKGQAVGALSLGARQTGALPPQELELLMAIGQQIGMAVENARLYQETEHWAEGMALLHELSKSLIATLDPDEVYDQITQQSARLLDCPMAQLLRWDEEHQEAVSVASYGVNEPWAGDIGLRLDEAPILAGLLNKRHSIPIADAQTDPRVPASWRDRLGIKALLGLTVSGTGETLGFLFVMDPREPRRWRPDEVDLLESFVDRAAIALENAQLHKQLEWAATLEERQRIAAEMHDGLAQTLSYLGLQTDHAAELLDAGRVEQVLEEFEQVRNTLSRASYDVRRSIASLQESPRPRQPLQECLHGIVSEFTVPGGPGVALASQIETPLYLPVYQLEQVERVVREGLLNASRHAQAQRINVGLEAAEDEITVRIEDDGRGFDPDLPATQEGEHFGLSIMRARAARVGGRVEIDSAPGQGTRVIFTWPRQDGAAQTRLDELSTTLTTVGAGGQVI
jgi:PAS domain S-box-containing protein